MDACYHGKTADAKRLIGEGAPVDWQDGGGWTPLHWASLFGHTEIVMLLLQKKCKLNVTAKHRNTPLVLAVKNNQMDTVRALVEAGCDVTIHGTANRTAAEWAKWEGHHAIAEYLSHDIRFLPYADDESEPRRVQGIATRALQRDLSMTGYLPAGPLSIIKEFATG